MTTLAASKPARLYYGWVMVGGLAITQTVGWGILYYAFSIFVTPMEEALGWSRAAMTGAFSLALLVNGLAGLAVGSWLDRHGARTLMTVGSVSALVLVWLWGSVGNLTSFYMVWAGLGVTMALVLYEPAFAVIATWFVQKRGKALTILTFVGGLASVIFIPLSSTLIAAYDWRTALKILAVIMGGITIPIHALVLRRRPADLGLWPDGASFAPSLGHGKTERHTRPRVAMQSMTFWWLVGAFMLSTLTAVALIIHLIPYLLARGYSTGFAASLASGMGLISLPGRVIFTMLGDYFPRRWVTALIFALQPVGFAIVLAIPTTGGLIMGLGLLGLAMGAITPARAALVAEYYGAASYGSISSIVALFSTLARAIAPVGAGLIYDANDSYTPVLWVLFGIAVVSSLFLPLATPPQDEASTAD